MDFRATLVADAEPPVLVNPGQRPLRRPAGLAQPGSQSLGLRARVLTCDQHANPSAGTRYC